MRLETIPLLLGVLVGLMALAVIADAVIPDGTLITRERRRRPRPERNRSGEVAFGLGVLCMAAALIGRDTWPYTTLSIALAIVFVLIGAGLNIKYVRGLMLGPVLGRIARRRSTDVEPPRRIRVR